MLVVEPIEEVLEDNVIENDVKSTLSRRSSSSNRTSSSRKTTGSKYSLVSEQMDIVKKMQRDAMIAERYVKKKLDALKEIHKLRNLEISEMFSQYKDFNVDGDDDEFIETQSYLEISRN